MWIQFFLTQGHFALHLFTSLTMLSVAWLYGDAWMGKKMTREGIRTVGFLILSVSYLLSAITLEGFSTHTNILPFEFLSSLFTIFRSLGFLFVAISLFIDPLMAVPKNNGIQPKANLMILPILPILSSVIFAFMSGFLLLRKATIGLERHLLSFAIGLLLIAFSELLHSRQFFIDPNNLDHIAFLGAFGTLWIIESIVLLIGTLLTAKWIFGYLIKRLESQLLMIITSLIVCIFLLTTVTFTGLLIKQLADTTLRQLETDAHVLNYAITNRKDQLQSEAELFAKDTDLMEQVQNNNRQRISEKTTQYLLNRTLTSVIVTNKQSQVLAQGENPDRHGFSLSSDPLVIRGLLGETLTSVQSLEGVLAPVIHIRAVAPIKDGETIIGVVLVANALDSTLLDGVKKATGLEATIYSADVISATTMTGTDGVNRPLGIKETNKYVTSTVLVNKKTYTGSVRQSNKSLIAAYIPLSDSQGTVIGMLSVAKPERLIVESAGRSIELTFLLSGLLLVLSIFPTLLISRYITKQLK